MGFTVTDSTSPTVSIVDKQNEFALADDTGVVFVRPRLGTTGTPAFGWQDWYTREFTDNNPVIYLEDYHCFREFDIQGDSSLKPQSIYNQSMRLTKDQYATRHNVAGVMIGKLNFYQADHIKYVFTWENAEQDVFTDLPPEGSHSHDQLLLSTRLSDQLPEGLHIACHSTMIWIVPSNNTNVRIPPGILSMTAYVSTGIDEKLKSANVCKQPTPLQSNGLPIWVSSFTTVESKVYFTQGSGHTLIHGQPSNSIETFSFSIAVDGLYRVVVYGFSKFGAGHSLFINGQDGALINGSPTFSRLTGTTNNAALGSTVNLTKGYYTGGSISATSETNSVSLAVVPLTDSGVVLYLKGKSNIFPENPLFDATTDLLMPEYLPRKMWRFNHPSLYGFSLLKGRDKNVQGNLVGSVPVDTSGVNPTTEGILQAKVGINLYADDGLYNVYNAKTGVLIYSKNSIVDSNESDPVGKIGQLLIEPDTYYVIQVTSNKGTLVLFNTYREGVTTGLHYLKPYAPNLTTLDFTCDEACTTYQGSIIYTGGDPGGIGT